MDANAVIERAKKALEIEQDQELADHLGVSRTAVAAWRRRSSIPAKYLPEMLGGGTVSLDWLLTGEGEERTVNWVGLTEQPLRVDKEILWLALLAMKDELVRSNAATDQELSKLLTTSQLATVHIWLADYLTRIENSKSKWLASGLIKPADIYRALVTEYAVGRFDAPPPPWWDDETVI